MLAPVISNDQIATITDMRKDPNGLLREVEKGKMKYLLKKNKIRGVVMSMAEYKELLERMEDLDDELWARKVYEESKNDKGSIPLEEMMKEYGVGV